ncbi:MAG: type I methionyl aminopeptidase [Candidatus Peribacteraceae bacterium]|nr:type I methionyl aminopeptidase [Candidatus Peribacteraceae bacterium]MBP9851044.1 type I methionyl aminopeptidase [Candidatus Peribacteraceae bacterium]
MSAYTDTCQIFSAEQQESLRKGGAILRECLKHVASLVKPGISTLELDTAAEEFILGKGGVPAFKGYHGFPGTLCTSVNDQVVHGIPSAGPLLKNGDIVSLDGGVILDGLYTDACVTVGVGDIDPKTRSFLAHVSELLEAVIVEVVRAGVQVGDISSYIEKAVRRGGFGVVRTLTGHGLGDTLHQFPDVPNVGKAGTGPKLPVGTMIAIEPIATMGSPEVYTGIDNWTVLTKDTSLACHFEHSVIITEKGCEIIA